ncbi:hypothetical protein [Kineosporia succinea]|uniref:Uncharacterized protein YceK n=1 Tax=Kineosporia succinea TaxID=84632 RepID=A0ABT9PEK8_9ACTN|nr:hypothetical protein [Kineosporia succinea]MDP9830610.1 uncharacterized protein YceK [Kineosporia succinea]
MTKSFPTAQYRSVAVAAVALASILTLSGCGSASNNDAAAPVTADRILAVAGIPTSAEGYGPTR